MQQADLFESVLPEGERVGPKRRIAGSALFAFLLSLFIYKACDYTVPIIISDVQGVELADALESYAHSLILQLLTATVASTLGGFGTCQDF